MTRIPFLRKRLSIFIPDESDDVLGVSLTGAFFGSPTLPFLVPLWSRGGGERREPFTAFTLHHIRLSTALCPHPGCLLT